MARKAEGSDILEVAKAYISKAKTAETLRKAQAIVFPLAYGMSLEKTAEAKGSFDGFLLNLGGFLGTADFSRINRTGGFI